MEELVLPRIQFDHLHVVDGLSGDLHALIFPLHDHFLVGSDVLQNEVVGCECTAENGQTRQKRPSEPNEGDYDGHTQHQRYLDNVGDLVTNPEEPLRIDLDKVDDLTRGESFASCR